MSKKINRLLIFGSRDINNDAVRIAILEAIDKYKPDMLLTAGEPGGACEIARDDASELAYPLTLFFKHKHRATGMYHHRSVQALKGCDFCVFFYNGTSNGTRNEIALAKKMGVPYEIIVISSDAGFGWESTGEFKF